MAIQGKATVKERIIMSRQKLSNDELEKLMKKAAPRMKAKKNFTTDTMKKVNAIPNTKPFIKRKSTWAIFATAPAVLALVFLVSSQVFTGFVQEGGSNDTNTNQNQSSDVSDSATAASDARAVIDDINSGLNSLSDDEYSDSTLSDEALYQ